MRRTIAISFFLLSLTATAQVPDPTRPADTPLADGASAGTDNSLGLQAIIRRPGKGRSTALIAGQTVHIGSKVGEQRVVKIAENEVTLQGDKGREVLRLTPAIQKTPAAKPRAATHHVKQPPTGTPKK